MFFEVVSWPVDVAVIARGAAIRDLRRLRRSYGPGAWRKLKGDALVLLDGATLSLVELHWYEAHGLGRFEPKIKRVLRTLQ